MSVQGLYAIADSGFNPCRTMYELVKLLLSGGAPVIQLRMKHFSGPADDHERIVFETASGIMKLKDDFDFTFIVNDYVETAVKVGADGVHVGSNDLPVSEVRRIVGRDMIVGYSSHYLEEAVRAAEMGADYVAFGAVYPTSTKGQGHPVCGVDALSELIGRVDVPVVAIGGICRGNIDEVAATGVSAVAMITALSKAKDVSGETRWFVDRLRKIAFANQRG